MIGPRTQDDEFIRQYDPLAVARSASQTPNPFGEQPQMQYEPPTPAPPSPAPQPPPSPPSPQDAGLRAAINPFRRDPRFQGEIYRPYFVADDPRPTPGAPAPPPPPSTSGGTAATDAATGGTTGTGWGWSPEGQKKEFSYTQPQNWTPGQYLSGMPGFMHDRLLNTSDNALKYIVAREMTNINPLAGDPLTELVNRLRAMGIQVEVTGAGSGTLRFPQTGEVIDVLRGAPGGGFDQWQWMDLNDIARAGSQGSANANPTAVQQAAARSAVASRFTPQQMTDNPHGTLLAYLLSQYLGI